MTIMYPSIDDPRWIEGEPKDLKPGMFVQEARKVALVGDVHKWGYDCDCCDGGCNMQHPTATHYMPVNAIEVEQD